MLARRLAALLLACLASAAACGQEGLVTSATTGGSGGGTSSTGGDGGGGGSSVPPKPLVIVDWNTHNFFDTTNDNPNEDVLTAAQYSAKRKTIGGVLKTLNGDIVVLAEIENKAILDDLNKSELGGAYTQTILIDANDVRGIDVGVMTKIAPDSVVSHKADFFTKAGTNGPSYQYARDCLELHFTFNGRKVILLGVHLKAKDPLAPPGSPDTTADKRLAEAQHTRKIADDLHTKDPTAAILVLGDFNDVPGSAPIDAVEGAAPDLYADSASLVPMAYSYKYNKTNELIDHQIASPGMAALLDPKSVTILHGKGIDDNSPSASDHAPIKAVYQVH